MIGGYVEGNRPRGRRGERKYRISIARDMEGSKHHYRSGNRSRSREGFSVTIEESAGLEFRSKTPLLLL